MDTQRITRICEALIAATRDGLNGAGYPVPANQFVSAGAPVIDDELLACSFLRIVPTQGDPAGNNPAPIRSLVSRAGEFVVYNVMPAYVFETAAGETIAPSAAEQQDEAERVQGSLLAGINGVVTAAKTEQIGVGDLVVYLDSTIVGPEGGFVAIVDRWQVSLLANPTIGL